MDSNKTTSSFPVDKIKKSLVIALIIFVLGGIIMKNQAFVSAKSASILASVGLYNAAEGLVNGIDADYDEAHYKDGVYGIAKAMLRRGDYDSACEKFSGLGDYSDSKDKSYQCIQKKAEKLIKSGDYLEAGKLLKEVMFVDGSKELFNECQYRTALEKIDNEEWLVGLKILWSIKDYNDALYRAQSIAREQFDTEDVESLVGEGGIVAPEVMQDYLVVTEKREMLRNGAIAVGFYHTVGLSKNGKVFSCGRNESGQCNTDSWSNITQVAAGAYHTVGLRSDGTVVACGDNSNGQCDVSKWKNVVQICASDYNTAALLSDGTVVTCGFNEWSQAKGWSGITSISCGNYALCGISTSGDLYSTHLSCRMEGQFIDVAASTAYAVGLSQAGDVVYSSETPTDWTKAAAVFAGNETVGIIDQDFKPSVYDRRNAKYFELPDDSPAVSMSLGGTHFAVLYDDGSVFCKGLNDDGQCDTSGWNLN